ncbi:MAG: hypothetical protein PW845_15220 [Pseudomonas sp.]|uniref:hypothetical protein n=1 Tax=Pseudomonas abieticivorans TaxID=2931382 RepID=UPI0020BE5DB2|nr:hypothetical protein [Pseudomonas sp. PIA16]MDE1166694.1 hypothetical protein [Pseudomonas sp.]
MTPDRFAQLAEAYGADLHHWPRVERSPAQALLDQGDKQALDALRQARWLDGWLDSHRVASPAPGLARQIAASAELSPSPSFWTHWLSRAGFVGAGLAGIAAGMLVASLSLPLPHAADALPSILDQGDADIVFNLNAEESEQ